MTDECRWWQWHRAIGGQHNNLFIRSAGKPSCPACFPVLERDTIHTKCSWLRAEFIRRVTLQNKPAAPQNGHNNQRFYIRMTPGNVQAAFRPQQTTLSASKAFMAVSDRPSLLSICWSISPACCESHIIVTLTQGSVRQPEDLLLEIESRHLSCVSCFLTPVSILACRITRWVLNHKPLHRPHDGLSAQSKLILYYMQKESENNWAGWMINVRG